MTGERGARFLCSRWRALLPSSHHPAASQATPYNLNRYTLLGIYLFYTLMNSCLVLGWNRFVLMLYRQKAFIWACSAEEQLMHATEATPACARQETHIYQLFVVAYAAVLFSIAAAGILTDVAGPKVTALLGQVLSICSWLLLGASDANFRSLTPSFLLMGLGRGMTFLSMLCISCLFPGGVGFSLTLMGAASGTAIVTPYALNAAHTGGLSFKWVCWLYALLGPVSGLFIIMFFVPLEGFLDEDRYVFVRSRRVAHHQLSVAESSEPPRGPSQSGVISQHALSVTMQSLSEAGAGAVHATTISTLTDDAFFEGFHREACTFLFVAVGIYFTICSLAIVCYQQAAVLVTPLLKGGTSIVACIALPLCFSFGRLTDFCPVVTMMIINTCGALSFALVLAEDPIIGTASLCFFSIYAALSPTQVYIFIKRHFTSVHFGKLVGMACLFAGVASLCSHIFPDWEALHESKSQARFVVYISIAIIIGAYFLLVPMAIIAKQKRKELEEQRVIRLPTVYSATQAITMRSTMGQRPNLNA